MSSCQSGAADNPNRPYPAGTAWDEAWEQRQRADRLQQRYDGLERLAIDVVRAAAIGDQNFIRCLNTDEEGARLRRRLVQLTDFIRDEDATDG